MSRLTRRDLLKAGVKTSVGAAALTLMPSPLLTRLGGGVLKPLPPIQDAGVKELALRAMEASRAAGANYADIRLTHTYSGNANAFSSNSPFESMNVGVRALVSGYWGFASGAAWTPDEMVRLGREAVRQAKANALGKPRPLALAPTPKVVDGHWVTPVKIDPLLVDPAEIQDYCHALEMHASRLFAQALKKGRKFYGFTTGAGYGYTVVEKAFASTEGSFCTQHLCRSSASYTLSTGRKEGGMSGATAAAPLLATEGVGWETIRDQYDQLRAWVPRGIDELEEEIKIPVKPIEVGRYDTAVSGQVVAQLLSKTLGSATELDRALGYEANASGTSYLNDPFGMVGKQMVGAPTLTVTANRTAPRGLATVQWDDEGVAPEEFTLVKDGVLTDFQTTRESASWLKEYYGKRGVTVRSHGCAVAEDGGDAPLAQVPNLVMAPGREAQDFDALVRTLKRGLAIRSLSVTMDFQQLNGMGRPASNWEVYEVKDGRRIAVLDGSKLGILFRASELWKGLLAVGGPASVQSTAMAATKGEPQQDAMHTATAPAAVFKQLTLIDATRKP